MKQRVFSQMIAKVLAVSALGVTSVSAYAGSAAVDVNVTFTRALVVIAGDPIQFGNVLINGNAGTVNLNKLTSEVTWSGGVVNVDQAVSQRGFINFIAPRPGTVGITYPSQVTLTNTLIPSSQVTFSPAPEVTSRVISAYNEDVTIRIGGSLNFDVNTMEGLYNGSVTVTVDYT